MNTLLLAFDDEASLARGLARALDCPLALVDRHHFPDGETRLRLPAQLPPRVVLLRGLARTRMPSSPNCCWPPAARANWVRRRLLLVAPYLAYMRQDMAFTPGEVVSQRLLGRLLADAFDAVVTVDPHLHRVATLDAGAAGPPRRGLVRRGAAGRPRRAARCPAPCCWRPTKRPASGCARRRWRMGWTMPSATSSATATVTSNVALAARPASPAVRWCCWTTWPAPAAR